MVQVLERPATAPIIRSENPSGSTNEQQWTPHVISRIDGGGFKIAVPTQHAVTVTNPATETAEKTTVAVVLSSPPRVVIKSCRSEATGQTKHVHDITAEGV